MNNNTNQLNLLHDLLKDVKSKGADEAEAIRIDSASLSVAQRLGRPEKLERSENMGLGLRVLIGKQQAIVSSSDITTATLNDLATQAVRMAKSVPEDPFCGLAETQDLVTKFRDLDGCDPVEPSAELLIDLASQAENTARAVTGVTNTEGAECGWGRAEISLVATNGFSHCYSTTNFSLSTSVLAGEGTEMERDYDYSTAVHMNDLKSAEKLGLEAGKKAVNRLNPRKVKTCQVPVIFDPRASRSLVSHLSDAINGNSIARDTSFLKKKMGNSIFSPRVNIIDDPHRLRGLRSKPCDGEGLENKKRKIVDAGKLKTWLLDLRSGRQLNLKSTGHASRGIGGPPSPTATNIYMEGGKSTPESLIKDIKNGFFLTELIGFGVNGITGDYSRGASGFWIENGEIVYPVSEITIAGNLIQMFQELTPANDLEFLYGIDAPTVRIEGMTVAGR
ncbi:MAG: TldD/PmbA family protein [Pseudomonadota bacterium]|nr:TldD/PmbA family protein [Pseudomonadota bacterium]